MNKVHTFKWKKAAESSGCPLVKIFRDYHTWTHKGATTTALPWRRRKLIWPIFHSPAPLTHHVLLSSFSVETTPAVVVGSWQRVLWELVSGALTSCVDDDDDNLPVSTSMALSSMWDSPLVKKTSHEGGVWMSNHLICAIEY